MPDKITLLTDDFSGPAISESFVRQLHAYDPSLLVRWNPRKMRFTIEQCTQHYANGPGHTHLCARIYVLLVETPDKCMMPLGENVIQMIAARDVTKAGYGPDDLHRWIGDRNTEEEDKATEIKAKQDDAIKHASLFNRRQLLQAFNLISRHNMEINQ